MFDFMWMQVVKDNINTFIQIYVIVVFQKLVFQVLRESVLNILKLVRKN